MKALLEEQQASARDISSALGLPEKAVYDHLEHLRRSLQSESRRLEMIPAACQDCGFVFAKRSRLTRPGRCPDCRSTHLNEPLYSIREE
jgi:predicted Zn-ribbon and HTH transcriptional regulator